MKKFILVVLLLVVASMFIAHLRTSTAGVYLIVDVTHVNDGALYAQYIKQVLPVIASFGGKYKSRGPIISSLTGDWNPKRIIIIEFPSKERLEACFSSGSYRALRPLREAASTSRAIVVRGSRK